MSRIPKEYRERFNYVEIEDFLEHRLSNFAVKLEDLFAVIKIPKEMYPIDTYLETKFGRLKIFFTPETDRNWLLHRSRFNYPTKGFLDDIKNLPTQTPENIKEVYEDEFGSGDNDKENAKSEPMGEFKPN